jgi:hypothetical protein
MTAVSKNPNPFQTPAVNTKNHVWWAYVVLILLKGTSFTNNHPGSPTPLLEKGRLSPT